MRNQGEESPRFKEGLNDERFSPIYSRLKNIKSLHIVEPNLSTEKKDNKDNKISKLLEENGLLEKKYIQSQLYLKENIEKYEKLLHTNMALKETIFKLEDDNHQPKPSSSLVIQTKVFSISTSPKQKKIFTMPSSPRNPKDTTNQLAEIFINMKSRLKEVELQNQELASRLMINEDYKKLEVEQKNETALKIETKFDHSKSNLSHHSFIDSPNDRSMIQVEQDMVDLHQQKKKLKKENEKYIKKIVVLQNEIAFKDDELKNYKSEQAENKETYDKLQQYCSRLENEFLKTKGKITEALNEAFESGKTDLVEFIEKDILSVERRSLLATKKEIK